MHRFIFAALLIVGTQTAVLAGGGGQVKNKGHIKCHNKDSNWTALVALNPSTSLSSAGDLAEFTSRGGKVINPGGHVTFKDLKAGKYDLYHAMVPPNTLRLSPSEFTKQTVSVSNNKTTTVELRAPEFSEPTDE